MHYVTCTCTPNNIAFINKTQIINKKQGKQSTHAFLKNFKKRQNYEITENIMEKVFIRIK